MKLKRHLTQVRDVFAMRAHYGWVHYVTLRAKALAGPNQPLIDHLHRKLAAHTDARSAAFDAAYGTDTFTRLDVAVRESIPAHELCWGYGPINQDFFREMMRAVPTSLASFTFVDVGAGKGAALMLASEHGFRRYVGVELNGDLIETGRRNIEAYRAASGRDLDPEWVQTDFMKWPIPSEDALFFFNNPFPEALSLAAVQKLDAAVAEQGRRVLLVYRKAPANVGDHLHASKLWTPLRLAPYWRIYASPQLALELRQQRRRRARSPNARSASPASTPV